MQHPLLAPYPATMQHPLPSHHATPISEALILFLSNVAIHQPCTRIFNTSLETNLIQRSLWFSVRCQQPLSQEDPLGAWYSPLSVCCDISTGGIPAALETYSIQYLTRQYDSVCTPNTSLSAEGFARWSSTAILLIIVSRSLPLTTAGHAYTLWRNENPDEHINWYKHTCKSWSSVQVQ